MSVALVITTYQQLLVGLIIGGLLGYSLLRLRIYCHQNRGEALVSQTIQATFYPPNFHLLNHITLKLKDGTTQIDHILVSRFGVFVIETKDYSGWIFGGAEQATWTQVIFRRKFKFQNPIHQNMGHFQAVQNLLDFLPSDVIRSMVVFVGKAEFKNARPQGVYSISELVQHLQSQTQEVLSINRVQFCLGRLETARLALTEETDVQHVQNLERKHGRKISNSA
jgi:hypothetical protein